MTPPLRFNPPQPGCICPSLPDLMAADLEGVSLAACPLHEPDRHAALEAAHHRAEAEFLRQALKDPEPEPPPHPLLDALARKTSRTTLPLNASPQQMATAAGFGDAGTPDPKTPIDR